MGKIAEYKQPHWDDPRIPNPHNCSSSDGVAVYEDGGATCHACHTHLFPHKNSFNYYDFMGGKEGPRPTPQKSQEVKQMEDQEKALQLQTETRNYERAQFKGFPDRNITVQTAQKFGVKTDMRGHVYFPYYNRDMELCGFKVRTPDKKFRIIGTVSGQHVLLFGQQLFKGGGKVATVHEGEFDALAGYQLQGSKWVNVSIPTGAPSAEDPIRFNLDWFETFEFKIVAFDGDKPGREAAAAVSPIFEPGTCKVMQYPDDKKDACEFSKVNQENAYQQLFWNAKPFTPAGIVNLNEDFESLFEDAAMESFLYPWECLNIKTMGFRLKELVTLCSGSGMGKSTLVRELCYHILKTTEDNIGVLFLEEDKNKTKRGIMGVHARKALQLNEVFNECSREEIKEAFDATVGTGRFFAFDHFGSKEVDEIVNRIRYLVKGLKCKWIVLDHLSIVVSGIDNNDERKAIDVAMTKLRTLVEETGCGMFLVSHLKRVQGDKGHEEGAAITLAHLRGSQSIAQLSDMVIALEGNRQDEDPVLANLTHLRILKNRYAGMVGLSGTLFFDQEQGRLIDVDADAIAKLQDKLSGANNDPSFDFEDDEEF